MNFLLTGSITGINHLGEKLESENGASIIAVVMLLALLTLIGVVFTSMFSTGIDESVAGVSSARALYAAEAGLETSIGRLKKTPVASSWSWKDGYLDKAIGGGVFDAEILQYESRDSTLAATNACEAFESVTVTGGTNPARTVYATLAWPSANDMGLELYDNAVADCNNPLASANLLASSTTSDKPEVIRYLISAAPATVIYTARVTGVPGDSYRLRIAHPDESSFSAAKTCGQVHGPPYDQCMRAVISLGKSGNTRREVFAGFSRN